MEHQQHAVGGGVDIRFQVPVAKFDGGAERCHRVFQSVRRVSAVCHGNPRRGASGREEGLGLSHCLTPA